MRQARHVSRFWWLLRRAFVASYEDGCFGIAKAAAYSALLSFFPVLTAFATLLVQFKAQAVSDIVSKFLFEVAPPGTEELVLYAFAVRGQRPAFLLITATLVSAWAASGLMTSLMEGFQAAYRLPSGRSFVKQRLVAIFLVFFAALPVLGVSLLVLLGDRTEATLLSWVGVLPKGERLVGPVVLLGRLMRYLVSGGAIVLITSSLYYFGPNRRSSFRHVWRGAVLATVLWLIATMGFAWWVRNIANYNFFYGSIGAVIALLVWMYLLAAIALIGCEYNAERERLEIAQKSRGN